VFTLSGYLFFFVKITFLNISQVITSAAVYYMMVSVGSCCIEDL